ncbi:MAG TPA: hypothetical protein VK518_03740, partial [Puia sp.]|nr:hypothetical protein [Puia sp.]
NGKSIRGGHFPGMYFQSANVDIDFEKKSLSLEGDSLLILGNSLMSKPVHPSARKKRVKVKATIYPGFAIDLSDTAEDDMVFSLKGIIEDGVTINACSGLLVLHSMTNRNAPGGREWHATVYMHDDHDDEREIKLKLPMCSPGKNAELN